ncbi:MAG: asparaginase domain-containing protein [Gaiellaceae bacterium]
MRVEASSETDGRGAMITFAGGIHAVRTVRTVPTNAVRTFDSPGYGPIGDVDGAAVVFHRLPNRRQPLPAPTSVVTVDLIRPHAGSDAHMLQPALGSGLDARSALAGEAG